MWIQHRQRPNEGATALAMTTMAKGGTNLRDLPEFMAPEFALRNENYFVQNNKGLSKRKGITKAKEIAGNKPVTMLEY